MIKREDFTILLGNQTNSELKKKTLTMFVLHIPSWYPDDSKPLRVISSNATLKLLL